MATILKDILLQGISQNILPGNEQESRDWFRDKASKISSVNRNTLLNSDYVTGNIVPGFMYMFTYDPKGKKELPYYDTFPLVFPFDVTTTGFTGLNLHYLPKNLRAELMDGLYAFTNGKITDKTQVIFNYKLLKNASATTAFQPCVKRYLYKQVRSKFLMIPATEWDIALFLPTERFVKASINKVHRDSREIIGYGL